MNYGLTFVIINDDDYCLLDFHCVPDYVLSISHSLSHNTATLEKLCHDNPNFTVEEIREEDVNPSLSDSKAYT